MFDVSPFVAKLCGEAPKQRSFEPANVQLSDLTAPATKTYDETAQFVTIDSRNLKINSIAPHFPADRDVIAIDSTSIVLLCPRRFSRRHPSVGHYQAQRQKHYRKEQ
jgi:hypothetical protein